MEISRSNDRLAGGVVSAGDPDLSDAVGSWFNTNRTTDEIVRLDIARRGDRLVLRVFGAGEPDPIPWPETTAIPYVSALGSREVTGFEAHRDLGFMETHLAANLKYGVLVIQSYNRFKDGSGRGCYFTREFFHQDVAHDHGPGAAVGDDARWPFMMDADNPRVSPGGKIDLGELTGHWINSKRATRVIRELRLRHKGDGYRLHAEGAGAPRDWGEVPVTPFASGADARDAAGFHAVYDWGFQRMLLAANMNKGLLIIASYNLFLDGTPRANYFTREFFYQASGPWSVEG
jgi:hypothetical protein